MRSGCVQKTLYEILKELIKYYTKMYIINR